ncbi:MAG TPA: DNA polymerase III subunit beta [Bacteroidetes bacterium]|nr:DNA polymerase III subunit beta [Bacteroidota bacterium]
MKFNASSAQLSKDLSIAANAISPKAIMPILEDFLFKLEGNNLTISATNLETSIVINTEVTGHEDGSVALSAKILLDTLRTLPDQPITIETLDDKGLQITSAYGKYKMGIDDPDDFPDIESTPEEEGTSIEGLVLKSAIEKTMIAIGEVGVVRSSMSGVLFQLDFNKANFVSTDSHRLVKYTYNGLNFDSTKSFILPQKGLSLLKNAIVEDKEVHIFWNENSAFFEFEGFKIISTLINDDFPNYNNVIPVDNQNILNINRKDLMNSLKRLLIYANKSFNLVTFNLAEDSLTLATEDPEFAHDATEQLPCKYSGEPLTMGFSAKFFVELLGILNGEEVNIEFSNPKTPVLIKPVNQDSNQDLLLLIMPLIMQ